jgi:flagellar biosynthetic protein FliP
MTTRRQTKHLALAVSLLLAVATPVSAQVRPPAPATGAAQLSSAQQLAAAQLSQGQLSQAQLSQLSGASPLTVAQISKLAAAQGQTNPASPAPSRRAPLAPAPRITSAPVAPGDIGGVLQIPGVNGGSVPWNVIVMLTALTLIPSILVCMTPFARLLIVFHFLRQALGLQTTPSNQTLIGLSLIMTFFLMQPVANQIYQNAFVPMQANQITPVEALTRAEDPMRHFMAHYVRDKDVSLFVDLAHEPHPASIDDVSMRVLLPAYILSELKAGFQIGTVLFLPFLIVDMVVASITTSVGMLQLPPVVISTPLKLLLFLMVDGWHLLIGSLMRSFQ